MRGQERMYFGQLKFRSGRSSDGDGQRSLAVGLHQLASQSPGKIGDSLMQEGKWFDRSQTRVGVEIESAGDGTRQRRARDISAH